MKPTTFALGCAVFAIGCVSPKIPDDVPPPPPARKGEPYTAPTLGGEDDEIEEGFGGGDGFGGETPTMEVDAADLPEDADEEDSDDADEDEGEDEGEDDEPAAKKESEKAPSKDAKKTSAKPTEGEVTPKAASEN